LLMYLLSEPGGSWVFDYISTQTHEPSGSDRRYINNIYLYSAPIYFINFLSMLYFRQFLIIIIILF